MLERDGTIDALQKHQVNLTPQHDRHVVRMTTSGHGANFMTDIGEGLILHWFWIVFGRRSIARRLVYSKS